MNGHWTVVTAQGDHQPYPEWDSQDVVITKTVDSTGNITDGVPVQIDTFVPFTLSNRGTWIDDAIQASLNYIGQTS